MENIKRALFRSDVVRGIKDGKKGVDKEKGVINNFAVISKGEANGHDMEIDDIALEQIVELGNKTKIGIKSRFGHPNMSNTALGTFLGRVKNLWRDEDVVRGDIHFDKTAYKTPNGDLASYVMDLAENDPDAFGASIVFDAELEERLNKDGTRKKDKKTGQPLLPLVRFKKLWAVDTVDNPAANDGMFGTFFNEDIQISAEMTTFLDRFLGNPDAIEKTISFLQKYTTNREFLGGKFDCECISCGYKETYEDHCNKHKCPECGGQMRRVERPGPGQESQVKTQTKKEVDKMEFLELTVDVLKKERPDLFDSIHNEGLGAGKAEGLKNERARATEIVKESLGFKDAGELALKAVEEGLSVDKALLSFKDKQLKELEAGAPGSAGPNADEPEKGKMSHIDRAKAYQKEHGGSMTDALKVTVEPRKEETSQ